ncbi:hypothetical protein NP493_217g03025 [Ridgeia piscesae]|uniref:Uncharacterized protein n=1 Tax=Ridgeia piscesae TaxID=27915 RepID=A0AAD9UE26_RIDPI|nr:hypothetical protein NP493_217g03025 [Ridgeia piscesae]
MKETLNDGSYKNKNTVSVLTSPPFASSTAGPRDSVGGFLSMSLSVKSGSHCRVRSANDANGLLNMEHCSDTRMTGRAASQVTHCVGSDADTKPSNDSKSRNQQADCASIQDVDLVIESTPHLPEGPPRVCSGGMQKETAGKMENSCNVLVFPSVPTESSTDEPDMNKTTVVVHTAKSDAALDVPKKNSSETGNGKMNDVKHVTKTLTDPQTMTKTKEPIAALHNSKTETTGTTNHCKDGSSHSSLTKKVNTTNDVQPQPSTSASAPSVVGSRNRLTILPRTTQYEKHALLQNRQDSGMSELEEFFMEKEQQQQTGTPREEGERVSKTTGRLQLQPRGAQCEKSALLIKNKSGLSELEIYLLEKDAEASKKTSASFDDATSERRQRLQPRSSQYEESSLLENRDAKGLSAIEHFLHEKEDELAERGRKCGTNCVCKSATCPTCRPQNTGEPGEDSRPLSSSKRVHFKQRSSGSIEVQLDGKGVKSANQKSKQQGNPSRTTRWRHSLRLPRQHSKSGDAMSDSKTENNRNQIQSQKSCSVS